MATSLQPRRTASHGALDRRDRRQWRPWHAVLAAVGRLALMGPVGFGLIGAIYGAPLVDAVFGTVVVGVACVVALPAILQRGLRRLR